MISQPPGRRCDWSAFIGARAGDRGRTGTKKHRPEPARRSDYSIARASKSQRAGPHGRFLLFSSSRSLRVPTSGCCLCRRAEGISICQHAIHSKVGTVLSRRPVGRLQLRRNRTHRGIHRAVSKGRPARADLDRWCRLAAMASRRQGTVLHPGRQHVGRSCDQAGESSVGSGCGTPPVPNRVQNAALPYDVTRDGGRFLVNRSLDDASPTPISLVVNWPAALSK